MYLCYVSIPQSNRTDIWYDTNTEDQDLANFLPKVLLKTNEVLRLLK